jgi:hypothetical protein
MWDKEWDKCRILQVRNKVINICVRKAEKKVHKVESSKVNRLQDMEVRLSNVARWNNIVGRIWREKFSKW